MWILSGYYYPSAIPAKFGWGKVRVKHFWLAIFQRYSKILLQLSEYLISQENISVEINDVSSEIVRRPAT